MAITLDGIELPDLVIEGEFEQTAVESMVDISLGGAPIIWEQSIGGRQINLAGTSDEAWIKRSVLLLLQSLANVPGASYVLSYEGVEVMVRFRNEDKPAISAVPVVTRPNQEDDDYYRDVLIKLMEI